MRRSELDQLEAALRAANPVPRTGDLVESEEATAVGILVEHYTQPDRAPSRLEPGPARRVRPPGRPWMKPVVVFVAACLLALGTIGIVSMMRGGLSGDRSFHQFTSTMGLIVVFIGLGCLAK